MIIIDTNIVSEVMRRAPNPTVLAWVGEQAPEGVYLSAVTVAEIHYGLNLLDDPARRASLARRFQRFVADGFASRVLDFDQLVGECYGAVMARRRRAGRPMSVPDAQIAATAITHHSQLATRNTRDFDDLDIGLVNPFELF